MYNGPKRDQLEQCFFHLIEKWGQDFPVKSIKVPHIKLYRVDRLKEGAAPGTVNREKSALSKMFQILMEHELVDRNPARDVRNLSEKSGERQVYIGITDFPKVLAALPGWNRPFVQIAYCTGMRRGEALWLRWDQVDLKNRIITLGWGQTEERCPKRVSIHKKLVQILSDVGTDRSSMTDVIFLNDEGDPPHEDSLTRAWRTAVKALNFNPRPTVHDLRHCWKTNAMRSAIHPAIADMIVGHGNRKKDLQSLYLTVSDGNLVAAIDRMRFDSGDTEIWVSERGNGRLQR